MYIFNKKNYLKSSESKKASQRKMNSNPVEAKRRVTFERLCMKIKNNLDVDLQIRRTENKVANVRRKIVDLVAENLERKVKPIRQS